MKLRRIICWICLLAVAMSLFACSNGAGSETTVSTTAEEQTGTESGNEILLSQLSSYILVRPDEASSDLTAACTKLLSSLRGINNNTMNIKSDFHVENIAGLEIADYEIIVGDCDRPESQDYLSGLRYNDYGYAMYGNKIVIGGGSEDAVLRAIDSFRVNVITDAKKDGTLFYKASMDKLVRASYGVDKLSFCGTPVENYRIVYAAADKNTAISAAEGLRDSIIELCGITIEIVSDKTAAESGINEFVIGNTNRRVSPNKLGDSEYAVDCDGANIYIEGNNSFALINAVAKLNSMLPESKTESFNLTPSLVKESYSTEKLKSMSFNVLVSSVSAERENAVISMVRKYMPDTVGFQEASPSWMTTLKKGLSDIYAYVGEGRDGGNSGEYNPIFYNKEKFNLISSGTKWLSDTPNSVSKYSESSLNRIYTYAVLERKSDGLRLLIVNTHFDHKSAEAREKQAKVLAAFLKENSSMPIVLTGDFNTTSDTSAYAAVVAGGMTNSMSVATTAERGATYTSFGNANKVIDFVFVNKSFVAVDLYRVCNENIDGVTPSDHHPVYIEYTAASW